MRLNVQLEDLPASVSLLVSGATNRSNPQALAGAQLQGNAYIFISPDSGISQVRFYLDDPSRTTPVRVESAAPFDFGGTGASGAGAWNADGVSAGSHTVSAEVDFGNGSSSVVSATFNTGTVAPSGPTLMVSGSSNRSNSVALSGASLTQNAYIHVSPDSGVSQVRFFLDDPTRSSAVTTEFTAPYDFQGTATGGAAAPWNPGSVSAGSHTISAEVSFSNGSSSVLNEAFSTGGGGTPTATPSATATSTAPAGNYDVYVSANSNRSSPALLNGQTLSGSQYVFILDDSGIQQARFWIDNRNRNGAADRVENVTPFDLMGGSATQAGALNTSNLSTGTHWVTVELDTAGGTQVVEGSFDVASGGSGGGGGGGGVPIPAGAIRINPGQSIQSVVNANPSGTTFVIGSGVHRMQTVVPKNNNTFIGEAGTILNGSRVLTSWNDACSGQYYAPNQTQQEGLIGGCNWRVSGPGANRCQYAEQVFVNGNSLMQVLNRSQVTASTFYFDYGADRIYIGQNPSGKQIEASVSQRAFGGSATNVTISGLLVEKYSTPAQMGAIQTYNGWTVTNNEVRLNHGYGIRGTNNTSILNNYVHHNGEMGIGGSGSDLLLQGNEIAYNHTEDFNLDWEAGGVKFTTGRNQVFRDNYIHHNDGRGIWTDLNVIDALVEDNVIENNDYEGIKHEIGYDIVIRNNTVRFNGIPHDDWIWGAQIMIQNSRNAQVYGNKVWVSASGGDGIAIADQTGRGSGQYGAHVSSGNIIRNNELHMLGTVGDTGQNCGAVGQGNVFNNNTYYGSSQYFSSVRRFMTWDWNNWNEWRQEGYEANGSIVITN